MGPAGLHPSPLGSAGAPGDRSGRRVNFCDRLGGGSAQPVQWPGPRGMRAERIHVLPPSLAPRGLCREQAAEYIGVSVSLFDEMVHDGRMPRPKRVNTRTIWDRHELDLSFAALPNDRAA